MSEQLLQMSDIIQVIEVLRTTELPELRVMFLGRDHPTAESVVEYYYSLTGRQVTRLYHYITPTLRHVSWHIDLSDGRGAVDERTDADIQDS